MKSADLEVAKPIAIQIWEMEKQLMEVAPSSRDRNLLMDLVRLEDKPVDTRTGGEQWEIEQILEKLAEKPPYRKQTRPPLTNAIQPIRPPQTAAERALQMEPQVRTHLKALEDHLALMGLDKIPNISFQVVDGYGPMKQRQADAAKRASLLAKAQLEAIAKLERGNVFTRIGRWLKNFFAPPKKAPKELELLELEVAHALNEAEKVARKE